MKFALTGGKTKFFGAGGRGYTADSLGQIDINDPDDITIATAAGHTNLEGTKGTLTVPTAGWKRQSSGLVLVDPALGSINWGDLAVGAAGNLAVPFATLGGRNPPPNTAKFVIASLVVALAATGVAGAMNSVQLASYFDAARTKAYRTHIIGEVEPAVVTGAVLATEELEVNLPVVLIAGVLKAVMVATYAGADGHTIAGTLLGYRD